MGIRRTTLPIPFHDQLTARPEFAAMCVSSWRETAAASLQSVSESIKAFETAQVPDQRSYAAWEAVTGAVEMAEMFATALLNHRSPKSSAFHAATNPAFKAVFENVRTSRFSFEEARDLLRLRSPRATGRRGLAVTRAWIKLIEGVQEAGTFVATYWCSQIESARWFRHFPGSLTIEEALRIDIGGNPQRDDVIARIRATPDLVDVVCHFDSQRGFHHVGLLREQVLSALAVATLTAELVVGWLVNAGMDPTMQPRKRIIFPHIHARLSDGDRALLRNSGYDLVH